MAFYFETSSINFLLNNLDDSEIILLRDGLKLVGDGKLCLSPITLWEIACTGKQETKEDLYRVCQILFEENWVLPSPIKLMDHYTASGCPTSETQDDFFNISGSIGDIWRDVSSDLSKTINISGNIIDENKIISKESSGILERLIKSHFMPNLNSDDEKFNYACELVNSIYRSVGFIVEDIAAGKIDQNRELIYKTAIFFVVSLLVLGISIDGYELKDFWKKRNMSDSIPDQINFLIHHYEPILHRGPILYAATMAVIQVEGKGNRGLYKDCLHAMYMAYCDVFFTCDKHFLEVKECEPAGFWKRIISLEEFWKGFLNSA